MEEFKLIKEKEKATALKKACEISESKGLVLFVIESVGVIGEDDPDEPYTIYYIDDNGFIRNYERLVATFENGKKIK